MTRSSAKRTPLPVTIGMPAYNGAAHIEQALAAQLEKSYRNFTLLVSDNALDDESLEISPKSGALEFKADKFLALHVSPGQDFQSDGCNL